MLAVLLASCGKAAPGGVEIALAGVTLADDCGEAAREPTQPWQATAQAQTTQRESAASAVEESMAKCAGPNCGHAYRGCDQTSMQLAMRATPGVAERTTVQIVKVELLDPSGKVLDVLKASKPSRWNEQGVYTAWDEHIAPGQAFATSYALQSPDWTKVAESRWLAHEKLFHLRVTVRIGSAETTLEKVSIQPAMLEPPVAT